MAHQRYTGEPLKVPIGKRSTVELPPRILRVRLTGMLFETDKTFLLPKAMRGVRGLVDLYSDHPGVAAVITGHTDRVGAPDYNLGLSEERTRSIDCYLKDDVNGWLKWYQDHPYSAAWGVREDQHMLSAITDDATGDGAFYRGPVHGLLDRPTKEAVTRFQRSHGLAEDGLLSLETRRALVTAYMQLDGTTLPAGAVVERLGCGEHHNEVPTSDGVAEEKNRRVEIFLFDPPPVDPPVPKRCPAKNCPYQEWKERIVETYDFQEDLAELVVACRDDLDRPVPGAEVTLSRGSETERRARSGDDGIAHFRALLPGRYNAAAEKTSHLSAMEQIEVSGTSGVLLKLAIDWSVFSFELRSAVGESTHDQEL